MSRIRCYHSPNYEADIGEHVMPIRKFEMVRRAIEAEGLPIDILAPTPVSDVDLLREHTADYLRAIATGEPLALAQSQKFPRSPGLAEAVRCSPAGTRRTPRRWSRSI